MVSIRDLWLRKRRAETYAKGIVECRFLDHVVGDQIELSALLGVEEMNGRSKVVKFIGDYDNGQAAVWIGLVDCSTNTVGNSILCRGCWQRKC